MKQFQTTIREFLYLSQNTLW